MFQLFTPDLIPVLSETGSVVEGMTAEEATALVFQHLGPRNPEIVVVNTETSEKVTSGAWCGKPRTKK